MSTTPPTIITNTKVNTPAGVGYVNGFSKLNPLTCVVEINITDENRHHLADDGCWTKEATHVALFEFLEKELTIAT
jgi:hypothetical protein